jgi:hypothetical protein
MVPRWARHVIAFLATLVVWAVAKPAFAAAPLCDFRGATAIAPTPELETPQTSIDAATGDDDDCLLSLTSVSAAQDGRAPEPTPPNASGGESAVLGAVSRVMSASSEIDGAKMDSLDGERSAERGRVDRPPRV